MEFLLTILSLLAVLFILVRRDMERMGVIYKEENEEDEKNIL